MGRMKDLFLEEMVRREIELEEEQWEPDYMVRDFVEIEESYRPSASSCDGECWDCSNAEDCGNSIFDRD